MTVMWAIEHKKNGALGPARGLPQLFDNPERAILYLSMEEPHDRRQCRVVRVSVRRLK